MNLYSQTGLFVILLESLYLKNETQDLSKIKGEISMKVDLLCGKIHRATVTQAELNYVGSITVDEDLFKSSI